MRRSTPIAIVACLALLTVRPVAAQEVAAEVFELENGMTFLLVPRHEEPNTISAGWVAKVGSVNERPGITGISHFFEHMMFKGTTTIGTRDAAADADFMRRQHEVKARIDAIVWGEQYERARAGEIDDPWHPDHDTDELKRLRAELRDLMDQHRAIIVENEFAKIYTEAGATGMNAFTSEDLTFYFINVPSNKFELWAWMESDRLTDSVFREFYAERDVVHEERRMGLESQPTGELDEQFEAMFWQSAPYSWTPIGWPSDIRSYTREQFDDYFNVYYRPNNLVGVVVGDFDPAAVKRLIESYFGPLERGASVPPPVVTLEVEQLAEKRLIGECGCQPQINVRYHTVPFDHADSFPLQVMSELLNGRTGRLYKGFVEGRKIASSARASQVDRKYAGYFAFESEVKGDATPEALLKAWDEEIRRLRGELATSAELQKVKNQIAADSYRRLQSNSALLMQLGVYAALGDWAYINESTRRLMAVTPADIMRVANTYFAPSNRCVAIYTRRPGASADGLPRLEDFPPQIQQSIAIMLEQMEERTADELSGLVTRMEAERKSVPPEFVPAIDYIIRTLKERIATAQATDDGEGNDE